MYYFTSNEWVYKILWIWQHEHVLDDEIKSDFDNDSDNDPDIDSNNDSFNDWVKMIFIIKVMATNDYYIFYFCNFIFDFHNFFFFIVVIFFIEVSQPVPGKWNFFIMGKK